MDGTPPRQHSLIPPPARWAGWLRWHPVTGQPGSQDTLPDSCGGLSSLTVFVGDSARSARESSASQRLICLDYLHGCRPPGLISSRFLRPRKGLKETNQREQLLLQSGFSHRSWGGGGGHWRSSSAHGRTPTRTRETAGGLWPREPTKGSNSGFGAENVWVWCRLFGGQLSNPQVLHPEAAACPPRAQVVRCRGPELCSPLGTNPVWGLLRAMEEAT